MTICGEPVGGYLEALRGRVVANFEENFIGGRYEGHDGVLVRGLPHVLTIHLWHTV
jgi:hypothetical protein